MTAHQYDQQANQALCVKSGEHVYVNNGPDSNLFGLEPNFGCCTANLHQGWPKLTEFLWMQSGDGLAAVSYAPCVVETRLQGKPIRLEVATEYPFRDTVRITVAVPEPMTFPLYLRVPAWAGAVEIQAREVAFSEGGAAFRDGAATFRPERPGAYLALAATWSGTRSLTLRFPMPVTLYRGYNDAVAILRGPLVYSLRVGAEWRKVKDNPKFADWEVVPTTPWNYALEIDRAHPERSVRFEQPAIEANFRGPEAAPVMARVKGRRVPAWTIERGAAAPPPPSPAAVDGPIEELILVPYGCTDLRITEFPTWSRP
jgi:hypothetical protein